MGPSALSYTWTFHHPKRKPHPMSSHTPLPGQPGTHFCICGSAWSGRFPSVESHPVCPSVSASLTKHLVLGVHPFWRECQGLSSWPSDALVWGGTTLQSPALSRCVSGRVHLFLLWKMLLWTWMSRFVWTPVFALFPPRRETARSHGNYVWPSE